MKKLLRGIGDFFNRLFAQDSEEVGDEERATITLSFPKTALKKINELGERTEGGTPEVFRQAMLLYDLTREHLVEDPRNDILFSFPDRTEVFPDNFFQSWRGKFYVIDGGKK